MFILFLIFMHVSGNVTLLNVTLGRVTHGSILITWNKFINEDSRTVLGYVVYLIEAPNRNVSLFEGRDACGGDGLVLFSYIILPCYKSMGNIKIVLYRWRVDDVPLELKQDYYMYIMTHLKPYTQYAFYVKTYTIAAERMGAQSPIHYVKTLPGGKLPLILCF